MQLNFAPTELLTKDSSGFYKQLVPNGTKQKTSV